MDVSMRGVYSPSHVHIVVPVRLKHHVEVSEKLRSDGG